MKECCHCYGGNLYPEFEANAIFQPLALSKIESEDKIKREAESSQKG